MATNISLNGEAASREKPVNPRRFTGSASVFHKVSVVEPMVTLSPILTTFFPSICLPLTRTPDLDPVSQITQPSSRLMSTAWSREAVASGR